MKIIGMLPVYNDEDIVSEVIEHLINQGIELVILDNGSTDNTFEICKKFLGKGVLNLSKFNSDYFNINLISRMLYDMALIHSPNWLILSGSDEFLESGKKNATLKTAISKADSTGYNLIQFDRFDFFMTDNDNESAKSIKQQLRYYSYQGDYVYRAWKYFPGIDVEFGGTHYPVFPIEKKYKIYPKKLVLRHYTFRTKEQAEKKMKDRIRRTIHNSENIPLIKFHYKKVLSQDFSRKNNHNLLTKYEGDNKWNFERKFTPYTVNIQRKREDVFSDDGTLKIKRKTVREFKLEIQDFKEKNHESRKKIKKFRLIRQELREKNLELRKKMKEDSSTIINQRKTMEKLKRIVDELKK